jgi:hypothetical protein
MVMQPPSLCIFFRSQLKYVTRFSDLAYILISSFNSRQGKDISLYSTSSRPPLETTQLPILWIPAALSLGVKRPYREAYHSPPSSADFKNSGDIPSLSNSIHGMVLN